MTNRNKQSRARRKLSEDSAGGGERVRVLLVTGMSGAGRTAALKSLEDIGYEAVDNLPLSLLASLVKPSIGALRPLAIGIDIRTRDFAVGPFLRLSTHRPGSARPGDRKLRPRMATGAFQFSGRSHPMNYA